VVVDLHGLSPLDLVGLRVLRVAAGWARHRHTSLRLADPSVFVSRAPGAAGLADLLLVSRSSPTPR
jgi:hypothetical protein